MLKMQLGVVVESLESNSEVEIPWDDKNIEEDPIAFLNEMKKKLLDSKADTIEVLRAFMNALPKIVEIFANSSEYSESTIVEVILESLRNCIEDVNTNVSKELLQSIYEQASNDL